MRRCRVVPAQVTALAGDTTRLPLALLARVDNVAVLDPACGSGAFLLSALRVLERLGGRDRKRIVERNLFGVDLKPEAVRLCELRLWLAIVAKGNEPQPLPNDTHSITSLFVLICEVRIAAGVEFLLVHFWHERLCQRNGLFAGQNWRVRPHWLQCSVHPPDWRRGHAKVNI